MKWTDTGIILSVRPFGESSRIVTLLTPTYGRHAGLIRISKLRSALNLEVGTFVAARWNGRLAEHLGQWSLESTAAMGARLLSMPLPLMALSSVCSLTDHCLPERHLYPHLFDQLKDLIIDLGETPNWAISYVNYELALLKDLGFGLDLSVCAASGVTEDLVYVSPKTGRAVSRLAGLPYHGHLLPLPAYWVDEAAQPDIYAALVVTGYFLNLHMGQKVGGGGNDSVGLPGIRQRLVQAIHQSSIIKSKIII